MNRNVAIAAGALAAWLVAIPAQAGGRVQWSVTVGSPGYVVAGPGVMVSPQPHYIYGPPPSAFAPPPTVVYVQPGYSTYPAYPVYPPPVVYVDPYGRPIESHGHRHRPHRHDWNGGHRGGRWDHRR